MVFYTGMSANSSAALKLSGVMGTPVRGMMLYEYSSCTCSFMKFMFPLVVHSIHGLSRSSSFLYARLLLNRSVC